MDGDDEYEQDFEQDEGVRKIPKPKSRSYSSRKEIEIKNMNSAAKKKEINETQNTNRSANNIDDSIGQLSKVAKLVGRVDPIRDNSNEKRGLTSSPSVQVLQTNAINLLSNSDIKVADH